jgi:hypothetical protein
MKSPATSALDREILWWVVLVLGIVLTLGGLVGIWLQGLFYRGGFPTAATLGEVRAAFTWPALVTTCGSLTVAVVVLASRITSSWSPGRRVVVFTGFGVFVLAGCALCGHLAALRVAAILKG